MIEYDAGCCPSAGSLGRAASTGGVETHVARLGNLRRGVSGPFGLGLLRFCAEGCELRGEAAEFTVL